MQEEGLPNQDPIYSSLKRTEETDKVAPLANIHNEHYAEINKVRMLFVV